MGRPIVTPFDWSDVDWEDMDAEDPRRFVRGFGQWGYYASPSYTREDGVTYQPREFRAGSESSARAIIESSPSGVGVITRWNTRTSQRDVVATVTHEGESNADDQ